jgi:hypothetical protein
MSTRCITPFYKKLEVVNGVTTGYVPFPCGKCPPCLRRRVSGWSFRLVKHGEQSNSALFVTLTYNEEKVPKTKSGLQTLVKADLQKFFKRLRKLTNEKISYYAVGEYGDKSERPHYHIILFNANHGIVEAAWSIDCVDIGHVHFGDVCDASIGYTLKYISKEKRIPTFNGDDRAKEFSVMSKGLGANYLNERTIKWHKTQIEERCYLPLKDGKKASMPRYYKDKLYKDGEKFRISVHMQKVSEEWADNLIQSIGEDNFNGKLAERHINEFRKMAKKSKQRQKL